MYRKSLICAAAVVAVAGGIVAVTVPATGSTPAAGSLTASSGPVTWSGGPFTAPNATGNAGTVDCTAPQSCDDFALTLTTPPGTGDTQQLSVKVGWANSTADFDVYVLDTAGNQVGVSASSSDPESVILPPDSGTYTVRVVPYLPLGSSYTATAKLVAKPTDTAPPSTAKAPLFTNYTPPAALSSDTDNAGEPSIGVDPKTDAVLFQSSLSTYKATFDDTVKPVPATWTDVSANAATGCPEGSTTSLDPILYTDTSTGRTFESQLTGVDSFSCYTDDDGKTWTPSQGGGLPSGVDHQTLGGGSYSPSDPLLATKTYDRSVYYCSQSIATAFCASSHNGGLTFGAGVPTYNLNQCGGLHGHLAIAPDGTVYLPNKSCGSNQAVVVSTDGGTTWNVRTVPGSTSGDNDPAVSVGSNGTLYFGYGNGDGTPHVAVSHDHGQTFGNLFDVGASLGIKNIVFPSMIAGDDNRAAFSFLGTTTGGNYQDTGKFTGVWYPYTAFTYDGGATWTTINDSPGDPVQRGSICTSGTTCGADRNLLDFIGSTIDTHGRVLVGYADGCINACVTDTSNPTNATGTHVYHDAYATIARQSCALGLYAAFDPKPNLALHHLTRTVTGPNSSSISVKMVNADRGAATGATVRILVDGKSLGLSTARTLTHGQTYVYTVNWNTTGLTGRHKITAIADPRDLLAESDETDNRIGTTVTLG